MPRESTESTASARRQSTAERLHSAALRLLRRLRLSDKRTGVGPARLSALSVLVYAGRQTLGRLAAIEDVRPPTMTRIAQGLEDDGLVARSPDPEDGRVFQVRATARGKRVLERGRQLRLAQLTRLMRDLDRADIACLERAGRIIEQMLG